MDIKTVEQQVTTIRFFDDEVRHYINHPSDLVAALTRATGIVPSPIVLDTQPVKPRKDKAKKTARKPVKHQANWATNGYAGHDSRPTSKGKVKCEGCGEFFAVQGLGPHKRGCPPYQLKKAADEARAKAA